MNTPPAKISTSTIVKENRGKPGGFQLFLVSQFLTDIRECYSLTITHVEVGCKRDNNDWTVRVTFSGATTPTSDRATGELQRLRAICRAQTRAKPQLRHLELENFSS